MKKIIQKQQKNDDLLSHLIREYDCYDNTKEIEELYKIVQDIYDLIEKGYLEKHKENGNFLFIANILQ